MRISLTLRLIAFAASATAGGAFGQSEVEPLAPVLEFDPAPGAAAPVAEAADGEPGFKIVPRVDQDPDGKLPKTTPGENGVSRSSSRAFVVHGKDSEVRGAFCVFAEEVKGELLDILRQPNRFTFPIHIHVRGHTANINSGKAVRASVAMTEGGGFSLMAVVDLGDRFTRDAMRKELITLLLAERIVGAHPNTDFSGRKVLPDWLRIGLSEAIEFKRRDRPTELFASIFKSGRMLSANEIIYGKPGEWNSVAGEIYRASCCGFALALIGQEDGADRLNGLIKDLAVFNGTSTALIEKHFPGAIGSENSIEKWWLLELATMAQPTVKDIMDPVASEEALGRCLEVRWMEKISLDAPAAVVTDKSERGERRRVWQVFRPRENTETVSTADTSAAEFRKELRTADLSDYGKFMSRADRAKILHNTEVALLQLSWRAFPLHRPMIEEYQILIERLRQGKTKGLDEQFSQLAAARVELLRASKDATDYLLHYQATKVGQLSGAFEPYKKALEEVSKPLPPRTDPLSKYLDELDKEYR